jgi:biotin synthase
MTVNEVSEAADKAKNGGASRLCMGAAWREVRDNSDFDRVLEMVKTVNEKGMEVCCTLGMLTESQAQKLADAGLYAYNHNLDTSEENYSTIITTRTYADRLQTLQHVRDAKLTVSRCLTQEERAQFHVATSSYTARGRRSTASVSAQRAAW